MSRFSQSEHLEAKLRIQGREVPFLGVRVSGGVNTPSTASVHLIPSSFAKKIRPNTVFQVFYKCHYSSLITGKDIYRLLFEGEMIGRSFNKVTGRKAITIHCVDFMNYWLHAKQYYLNFQQSHFLSAADSALFGGVSKTQAELLGSKGRIMSFFSGKDSTFDKVVAKILEDVRSVNAYFDYNVGRTQVLERMMSMSTEKMVSSVFKHQLFQSFIRQQINKLGGTVSVWSIVTMLLNLVHHEIVSCPTPSFIPRHNLHEGLGFDTNWTSETIKRYTSEWKQSSKLNTESSASSSAPTTSSLMIKPNAWNTEPPACNIFFPNEVESMTFSTNYQNKITRFQLIPTSPVFKNQDITNLTAVYQPNSLHQYIRNNYGKKLPSGVTSTRGQGRLREFDFLTNEELERGIIPGFSTILPGAASMLMSHVKEKKGKEAKKEKDKGKIIFTNSVFEFIHNLAQFEFHRKRAASSSFELQSVFKPSVVAGSPAVFIDDGDNHVIAYLAQFSHTIMPSGRGSTQCSFALARDLNEEVPSFDQAESGLNRPLRRESIEPPIPDWFDQKYHHGRIGKEVYAPTLGCTGLLNKGLKNEEDISFANPSMQQQRLDAGQLIENQQITKLHQEEVRTKTNQAVEKLKSEYISSLINGQHGYYTFLKTFRPIVTEEQLFEQIYKGDLKGAKSYTSDSTYVGDVKFSRVEARLFGNKVVGTKSEDRKKSSLRTTEAINLSDVQAEKNNLSITYPTSSNSPLYLDWKVSDPALGIPNNGIFIKSSIGSPVRAVWDGRVIFSRNVDIGTEKKVVHIKHEKDGITFYTHYALLSDALVRIGDKVLQGNTIGRTGTSNTGNLNGLYFELRVDENNKVSSADPLLHFIDKPSPVYASDAKKRRTNAVVSSKKKITNAKTVTAEKKTPTIDISYPPPKIRPPISVLTSKKTGHHFLATAISQSIDANGKVTKYTWGAAGPPAIGFDCSGLVFGVAKLFNVSLRRYSKDMYNFSLIKIPVQQAFNTPGAVLFEFREKDVASGRSSPTRHVGLSMGDGKRTLEAFNSNQGVRVFNRAKASAWTHAGIIPGFDYSGVFNKDTANLNSSSFVEYFRDTQRRIDIIADNRNDIVDKYQFELANFSIFEG